MHISAGPLPGTLVITLTTFSDLRGSFVKTFSSSVYAQAGLDFTYHEEFYSLSKRDVIRGMHFQLPPYDHVKSVFCPIGSVLDVLLDLRPGPGYGKSAGVLLDQDAPKVLIIPTGIAHGFKSLQDNSVMVYKTSTEHMPSHDTGLRWDSFGFDWGDGEQIVSGRDLSHPPFANFTTPF